MPLVFVSAFLPLLAALLATGVVVTAPGPWQRPAAVLLAGDLIVMGTVALVGMVLGRSRWARRLGIGVSAAGLAVATAAGSGVLWRVTVFASAVALGALTGPWLKGWVRERPAALGPPAVAVNLEVLLLAVPGLVGAAGFDGLGVAGTVGALAALPVALWYGRTGPGAVVAVRVLFPAAAVATGLADRSPAGVALAVLGAVCAALAWTPGARLAARPLTRRERPVPIPPELTPPEVLEAAGLDDRGRRRPR